MNGEGGFEGLLLEQRYRVERILGRGGMATVYLATDEKLDRPVAIKIPRESLLLEPGFARRFRQETRNLIKLDHPRIVKVHDVAEHEGVPFVVMQYLSGSSLRERLDAKWGPCTVDEIAGWLRAVAEGLDYLKSKDLVHRDVKPENILFDGSNNAFLADFGIAKILGNETGMTMTGMTPGTPWYMAPEIATDARLGGAYDQYSLATIVYEAVTGERPFQADNPLLLLRKKDQQKPRPITTPGLAGNRRAVAAIMRGLDRLPEKRFPSSREFARGVLTPAEEIRWGAACARRLERWKDRGAGVSASCGEALRGAAVGVAGRIRSFRAARTHKKGTRSTRSPRNLSGDAPVERVVRRKHSPVTPARSRFDAARSALLRPLPIAGILAAIATLAIVFMLTRSTPPQSVTDAPVNAPGEGVTPPSSSGGNRTDSVGPVAGHEPSNEDTASEPAIHEERTPSLAARFVSLKPTGASPLEVEALFEVDAEPPVSRVLIDGAPYDVQDGEVSCKLEVTDRPTAVEIVVPEEESALFETSPIEVTIKRPSTDDWHVELATGGEDHVFSRDSEISWTSDRPVAFAWIEINGVPVPAGVDGASIKTTGGFSEMADDASTAQLRLELVTPDGAYKEHREEKLAVDFLSPSLTTLTVNGASVILSDPMEPCIVDRSPIRVEGTTEEELRQAILEIDGREYSGHPRADGNGWRFHFECDYRERLNLNLIDMAGNQTPLVVRLEKAEPAISVKSAEEAYKSVSGDNQSYVARLCITSRVDLRSVTVDSKKTHWSNENGTNTWTTVSAVTLMRYYNFKYTPRTLRISVIDPFGDEHVTKWCWDRSNKRFVREDKKGD